MSVVIIELLDIEGSLRENENHVAALRHPVI